MSTLAGRERAQLCDLFTEVGPDAPTLCAGWTTRDLAAHLVVRESRPDAAIGLVIKPLARYGDAVRARTAAQPWAQLVRAVRSGPPPWSPLGLPLLGDWLNTVELFVHHEDVRRARPDWAPRDLRGREQDALWADLRRSAPALYRHSPVALVLRRPDGAQTRAHTGGGRATVTVTGEPAELLLHAFGRGAQAKVDLRGAPGDLDALRRAGLGL